ncbi:MAG: DUF5622 domain-containing protein [Acidilobaceae archaeon]|nr:DUF5622 domain-containing protein [Acidilobaceae archaeon]MCX8165224.1 DUF5622 domain-containing protein [Acidilobaceae archaeon]
MGGKHGKFAYVKRKDGLYVKVRLLKSREQDPSKYLVVGPAVRSPPPGFELMKEEELPEGKREELYKA